MGVKIGRSRPIRAGSFHFLNSHIAIKNIYCKIEKKTMFFEKVRIVFEILYQLTKLKTSLICVFLA